MSKHTTQVYKVYNYLKANNVGIPNAISNYDLAFAFNLDKRTIRRIINEINNTESIDDFNKIIGSCNSGYYVATEEDYKISLSREWKSVITRLARLKSISNKIGLEGQYKMQLGKYYADCIETFAKEN